MMRLVLKMLGVVLACGVVLGIGGYAYLLLAYPAVGPAAEIRIEPTPDRLARGKYLADHVAVCTDCHSQRDWTRYAAPIKPDTYGAGGETWDETVDFPGRLVARNITPTGLGTWSDGEIIRAVTEGVSRDGTPLFPLMPYTIYGSHMAQDDVQALVAYLRTIPPRTQQIADRQLHFPLPLIVRTMPTRATGPATRPDATDPIAYGSYLANIAGCAECHTPTDARRTPLPELRLAGGQEFPLPNGLIARSANLTPDASGIGGWSEMQFVEKFKTYADPAAHVPVSAADFNTPMPWQSYSGMTREDLGAIFRYLQSLKPIAHPVEKVGRRPTATN
jgi:mono/diheme cytochrome c family protein